MGSQAIEDPGEIGLDRHPDRPARRNDPQEDAGSVGPLGASSEEHVEAELGDLLELAFGGSVVDRELRIVDEAEECVAVIVVVANRRSEWLRWEQRRRR